MLTEEQRNKLHIPSREEFHRLDAGLIIESDYEGHPNNTLKQTIKSWSFDKRLRKICSKSGQEIQLR